MNPLEKLEIEDLVREIFNEPQPQEEQHPMPKWKGIRNGTPGSTRLCDTCQGSVIQKFDNGQEAIFCQYLSDGVNKSAITQIVVECSSYQNKTEKSLYEMKGIAWILEMKKGQIIGFVSPAEFKKKKGEGEEDPDPLPGRN